MVRRNLHDPVQERRDLEAEEPKLQEDISRAQKAEQIMANPLVDEALTALRNEAYSAFVSADPSNPIQLAAARNKFDAVNEFQEKFQHHIETGRLATEELGRVRQAVRDIPRVLGSLI